MAVNGTYGDVIVTSSAPYVKGVSSYSVNVTPRSGYTITGVDLYVGRPMVHRSGAGSLTLQTNYAGMDIAVNVGITAVSAGTTYKERLFVESIDVYEAILGIGSLSATRTDTTGKALDEGTNACLETQIIYTPFEYHYLLKPTVKVNDVATNNVTWYTTWSADSGFSNAVDWVNYAPASPITLYGKMTDTFSDSVNYTISVEPRTNAMTAAAKTTVLPQPFRLLSGRAGGKGLGVGMKPTSDAFWIGILTEIAAKKDINFNLDTSDTVDNNLSILLGQVGIGSALKEILTYLIRATKVDYVVTQGTETTTTDPTAAGMTWTYRTWNSGVAECWGVATQTVTSWKTWGSYYYYGDPYTPYNYPHNLFKSGTYPVITANGGTTSGISNGDIASIGFGGASSTTGNHEHTPTLYVTRPTSGNTGSFKIFIHAYGVWK